MSEVPGMSITRRIIHATEQLHMPKPGTPLNHYLREIQEKASKGGDGGLLRKVRKGEKWIPPP